jgi:integrase/recombinase XerD
MLGRMVGTIKSWIDPRIERIWRENRGLSDAVMVMYRERVQNFVDYCRGRGLSEQSELTLAGARRFARWYARRNRAKFCPVWKSSRGALRNWAEARRILGEALPEWKPSAAPPAWPSLIEEFAEHVRRHRGDAPQTIHRKAQHVMRFLAFVRLRGRSEWDLRLTDIDAFILQLRARYSRSFVSHYCSHLRGFARFLRATGRRSVDLAPSIMAPIVRRAEHPYRTLPWSDVQRILRAVDLTARGGRRDYALLLMMSVYGFGAAEVGGLKLEDIDWHAGTLRVVRPKTGVEFPLPLLPAVARAVARYLRQERPPHPGTRHLFVTVRTPHASLACSTSIRNILHKHARRAGVAAPFLGTHVLRHTHAGRHIELGTKPKVLSDILGHRDPQSSSTYIRVATERLRRMALPVPPLAAPR